MSSQAVIRTYLTIAGLYTLSASLICGVNTLFLADYIATPAPHPPGATSATGLPDISTVDSVARRDN